MALANLLFGGSVFQLLLHRSWLSVSLHQPESGETGSQNSDADDWPRIVTKVQEEPANGYERQPCPDCWEVRHKPQRS